MLTTEFDYKISIMFSISCPKCFLLYGNRKEGTQGRKWQSGLLDFEKKNLKDFIYIFLHKDSTLHCDLTLSLWIMIWTIWNPNYLRMLPHKFLAKRLRPLWSHPTSRNNDLRKLESKLLENASTFLANWFLERIVYAFIYFCNWLQPITVVSVWRIRQISLFVHTWRFTLLWYLCSDSFM